MGYPIYGEPPAKGTPTWLRLRRTGIGGSDAAAALGVSPWSSALGVWEQKRGLVPDTDATERMVWGNRLEHVVRSGFNKDYGTHYRKPREMMRHERWPFVIGNLDGIDGSRVLEVKTADYKRGDWGEEGSADIPAHYYCQVQHYLMVIAGDVSEVAVLFGGNKMERYEVPADREFQEAMLDDEARLWEQVVAGTPPDPDGSVDAGAVLRRMYPHVDTEQVEATPEVELQLLDYIAAKARAKAEATEAERLAQQLQAYMGSAGKLIGSQATATWTERAGSTKWKEVAKAYREALRNTQDARIDAGWWTDEALDAIEAANRGEPSRTFSGRSLTK